MRLRHIKGSEEIIAANRFVINNPEENAGNWHAFFSSLTESSPTNHQGPVAETETSRVPEAEPSHTRPIYLEVGMGKGRFIMDQARLHPDRSFLGIEMYSSVLLRALQKMEEEELSNLRFLREDAAYIEEWFAPGEVDGIYLNFSDPWPKDRHAKRRLPGRVFLKRFATILKDGGLIEFKTDNAELFDFALEEIEPGGFELLKITRDLHNDSIMMESNIMTEYEERFSSKGNPICKYVIRKK